MKKIITSFVVFIAILSIIGIIYGQNTKTPKSNQSVVKIGFAPYVSPFFAAIEKGYFENEGIKAELISMPSPINAMQALVKGEIDVLSVPYSVLFTFENSFPGKFKIFGGVIEPLDKPYSYLIVKDNINSPEDLVGKKILTRSGSNAKIQAELVLKGLNIDPQKIELIQVESPLTAATFAKDEISASIDNEPSSTSILRKTGGKILVEAVRPKYLINPYPSTAFIFSIDFVNNNKAVADKFVKANDEAIDFINNHDSEFRSITEKYLKLDHEIVFSMSPAVFEKSSQINKEAINNEMMFEYNNKILKQEVDLTNAYYK